MDLKTCIKNQKKDHLVQGLGDLFDGFMPPAFGSMHEKEGELILLQCLQRIGFISDTPSLYELVSKLRVTRPNARSLLYKNELRQYASDLLDARVKEELKRPLLQKQGDLYVLEIQSPLLIDHLRSQLFHLGLAADGSFSPNMVKITLDAVVDLIQSYLTEEQTVDVKKALVAAGAPDTSFKSVLKAAIKEVAKKVASDAGDQAVQRAGKYLGPIIDGVADRASASFESLFK